jgi:hypothetical protein
MTGIIELEPNLPAGRVRLNVRTPEGRVMSFRPDVTQRSPGQPTEQYEAEWYGYWQQQVGKTITFETNRYGAITSARSAS